MSELYFPIIYYLRFTIGDTEKFANHLVRETHPAGSFWGVPERASAFRTGYGAWSTQRLSRGR